MTVPYRGRFAPTPSGPLHFGSLVAAAGSYLDARKHGGEWLVRMEDLDPPRVVPGAADQILSTLEAYGFEWDGPVMWQGARAGAYRDALYQLQKASLVFACHCPRSGCAGGCRDLRADCSSPASWRVRAPNERIKWADRLCGPQDEAVPEFVVLRADGVFSYQLAVAADDAAQGITDVVRGADLLESTARQILLQRLLGYPTPRYLHLPVARNAAGEKLSKQTKAPAIPPSGDAGLLASALRFLGYSPPPELASIAALWPWAMKSQAAALCSTIDGEAEGKPK